MKEFEGQEFSLVEEEICPHHSYQFVVRVNGGGAYWSSLPGDETAKFKVELIAKDHTNVMLSPGAMRGVTLVWRWRAVRGFADLPPVIETALSWDGNDPLEKLRAMQHHIERWQTECDNRVAEFVSTAAVEKNFL